MLPTDLTVSALVTRDERYLTVHESVAGSIVITQPGGHIEAGESPEETAVRETLEESRCEIRVTELLGVYLWIHPQTRQNFLRIVYVADYLGEQPERRLDGGIEVVRWYSRVELERRSRQLRTPIVLRCIDDFETGRRPPRDFLNRMLPVQRHVSDMLASALLV